MKKILRSWGTFGNLGVEAGPVVQIMLVSFGLWVGWWGGGLEYLVQGNGQWETFILELGNT